eukprot:156459_1
MTSLLALHFLCPKLPLERKLPEIYRIIWESFNSERHRVHNKNGNKKIRDRNRIHMNEYNDLNRIHMNEDLRLDIQNILRKQYMEISKNNNNNIGLIDMGCEDIQQIDKR